MTYAKDTTVSAEKSRAEIERTLTRYGATAFMYGWEGNRAIIQFRASDRQVKFILPLPDREKFKTSPAGRHRDKDSAEKAWEQACRSSWRALALVIKAKLEAVEAKIVTFEKEFLAHIVLPDGKTVYDHTQRAIESAYLTKQVPPMLGYTKK